MCLVKKPKIPKPKPGDEKEKDPPVIRNPLLDGMLGNIAAIRNGRGMFRIDLLNPLAIPMGGPGTGIGGGGTVTIGGGTSTGGGASSGGSSSGSSGGGSSSGFDGGSLSNNDSGRSFNTVYQ